ncbi:MAG: Rieske 2Fe-2S domain-containing protein [Ilumatobacter sp.]
MTFLKNTWYCAGWGNEVGPDDLIGRKLLGESVLLYRKEDGTAVAIGNACPHRFAPLSMGTKVGDDVACPYHGLAFNSDGECTLNPFSETIPAAAKVASYTLVERWQALWIWMGDQDKADPDMIPDFSMVEPGEGVGWVNGSHEVAANYMLVVDNLLDRSHVQFMHPLLIHGGAAVEGYEDVQSCEQIGDMIWDYHHELNCPKYTLLSALWPEAPELTENYFDVRWEAPGNMLLDSGTVEMGSDRQVGAKTPMANLVTPADEHNSHYFWSQQRNMQVDTPGIDEKIKGGVSHTFKNEDGAIVAACEELMGGAELMDLNPVFLPGDAASIRARRIMAEKIAAEAEAANTVEVSVG